MQLPSLVGGRRPCGCGPVAHRRSCELARPEERAIYKASLRRYMEALFGPLNLRRSERTNDC